MFIACKILVLSFKKFYLSGIYENLQIFIISGKINYNQVGKIYLIIINGIYFNLKIIDPNKKLQVT